MVRIFEKISLDRLNEFDSWGAGRLRINHTLVDIYLVNYLSVRINSSEIYKIMIEYQPKPDWDPLQREGTHGVEGRVFVNPDSSS